MVARMVSYGKNISDYIKYGVLQSSLRQLRLLVKIVADIGSAYEIIKLKGYTSWAIGIMVSTLCSAILRNQRQLYTLSTNAKA